MGRKRTLRTGFENARFGARPNIEHNKDYPTATMDPWDFKHRAGCQMRF